MTPRFGLGSRGAGPGVPGDRETCADPFTICHRAWLWVSFILLAPHGGSKSFYCLEHKKGKISRFQGQPRLREVH